MDSPVSRWLAVQGAPGWGTTAARRWRQAPDPAAVALDPRSDADQIRFVRELAQQLLWQAPGAAESKNAAAALDWQAFCCREDLSPEAIAAFVGAFEDGHNLDGEQRGWIGRPHHALLLAFIHLLRHQRQLLNDLPRRHLHHYYQDRLGFQPRGGEPDRVTVAFTLADGAPPLLLKAGSLLRAGLDRQGRERRYRTLADLSVNHTRIARLRSVQLRQALVDLEAIQASELDATTRLNRMLALVDAAPPASGEQPPAQRLQALVPWLTFCGESLHLEFQEFLRLMALVRQQGDAGSDLEWAVINRWLGLESLFAEGVLDDPRDFQRNVNASLLGPAGGQVDWKGHGLSDVNNIDDIYRDRDVESVRSVLRSLFTAEACSLQIPENSTEVFKDRLTTFERVMTRKLFIDAQWQEVNQLLERSGQRQRQLPSWRLDPDKFNTSSPAFSTNVTLALGGEQASRSLPWPGTHAAPEAPWPGIASRCESYASALEALRDRWGLPLERLLRLSQRADQVLDGRGGPGAWQEIRELLLSAHQERWAAKRRDALARARQGQAGAEALLRTLRQALSASAPQSDRASAVVTQTEPHLQKPEPQDQSAAQCLEQLSPWLSQGALNTLEDFNVQLLEPVSAPRGLSWRQVDDLLERAQRARDRVEAPPLARLDWRLVEAREQDIDPKAMAAGDPLAPCFRPAASRSGEAPTPGPGFAIASRLLGLAEGNRRIRLRLSFLAASGSAEGLLAALTPPVGQSLKPEACAGAVPQPPDQPGWGMNQVLLVEVTTAAGWWALPIQAAVLEPVGADAPDPWALTLEFSLAAAAPPLEPLPSTELPRLRLRLRPFGGSEETPWRNFTGLDGLRLVGARLQVAVEGLKGLRLQQDGTSVDPRAPFTPFSSAPMVGSSLLLSHPELLDGDLETLRFQGRWQKLPTDLEGHYSAYRGWPGLPPEQTLTAASFRMDVSLVARQQGVLQEQRAVPLFMAASDASAPDQLDAVCGFIAPPTTPMPPGAPLSGAQGGDGDLRERERVWRWRLTPTDFGHGLYPRLMAQWAQDLTVALRAAADQQSLAAALATSSAPAQDAKAVTQSADFSVSAPYCPLLEGLEVSYSRSQELGACAAAAGQLRRVHLFEEEEPLVLPPPPRPGGEPSSVEPPLLIPSQLDPGELRLELVGVRPGQPLTLALQLAEGSARGPRPDPAVLWEVRQGWGWQPLPVRQDGSDGLLHSGIVCLSLPDALVADGQNPARLWIRARLRGPLEGYAALLAVQTQAVEAEAVAAEGEGEPARGDGPLPPHSITGLEDVLPEIAAIQQPFSSRQGRAAETPAELAIRASERLRHKGRALSGWDYERLLWERFASQLHAVMCLPSSEGQRVELVVIPNLLHQVPRNPFAPGAPADQLEAMGRYLRECCPPELELVVRNARYAHVKVRLWVCLREGVDPAWAEQQLRQQVIRTLTAWCFDANAEARLGGEVRACDLVAAIDPLPFVAYLERLMLFLVDPDGKPLQLDDQASSSPDRLRAPGADVVLIASASQAVEFVAPAAAPLPTLIGIGAVRIGLDFQVP